MPSESETLHYMTGKPFSELDLVLETGSLESQTLRRWSYSNGHGKEEIRSRYTNPRNFLATTESNYLLIWMVVCELLFALRRPHDPERGWGHGDISDWWWGKYRNDPEAYLVYDRDDIKYGWVLYLDIDSAPDATYLTSSQVGMFGGAFLQPVPVFRIDHQMIFKGEGPSGGGTETQATFQPGGIEADKSTTPLEIPEFPKWSDKIKEKFHRSDDKSMANWDKSLDDWQVELQVTLAN